MAQLSKPARPTEPGDTAASPERRRPGRVENVNPALIPLLREETVRDDAVLERAGDDLDPARGIGVGIVLGVLLWAALAFALYWLLAG